MVVKKKKDSFYAVMRIIMILKLVCVRLWSSINEEKEKAEEPILSIRQEKVYWPYGEHSILLEKKVKKVKRKKEEKKDGRL